MSEARAYAEHVGDPVEVDASTIVHRYWLHKTRIDAEYRIRQISAGSLLDSASHLRDYLARLREDPCWRGCNIIAPLQEAAAALVDQRRPMAARLGTVDLIVRDGGMLTGCNSAATGFMLPLFGRISAMPSLKVLLVGAGCHARTIAHALDDLGLQLVIASRNLASARRLVAELNRGEVHKAVPLDLVSTLGSDFGLLINATPMGSSGNPPFPTFLEMLAPGAIVYDLVRDPVPTRLLISAQANGLTTIGGLEMLIARASLSFEGLFGKRPPREFDNQLQLLLSP